MYKLNIMNKRIITSAISLLVIILMPLFVYSALGIPCGVDINGDGVVKNMPGVTEECGFTDLIALSNNIIHFLIYDIAIPLTTLGFVWVGGNLILNQNKEGAWTEAKESFWSIGKGFAIILGSYVLIKFVLYQFLTTEQVNFMSFMLDLNP